MSWSGGSSNPASTFAGTLLHLREMDRGDTAGHTPPPDQGRQGGGAGAGAGAAVTIAPQVGMSLDLGTQQSLRMESSPKPRRSSSKTRSGRKPGASSRGRPPRRTSLLAPVRSLRDLCCLSSRKGLRLQRASHQRLHPQRAYSRRSPSTSPSLPKQLCQCWAPFLLLQM